MKRFEHKNNMNKTLKSQGQFLYRPGSKCLGCAINITVTMNNKPNMNITTKINEKKLCLNNSILSKLKMSN